MTLEEMIARPITGVRAFNELPIDASIWNEAHNHHHQHRRIHALAAHRPGIVHGLEVVLKDDQSVAVAPGLAIDDAGQTVVLSRATTLSFTERGQCYLILRYQPKRDSGSKVRVGSGEELFRLVEDREVVVTKELPDAPYLELARVYRTNAGKAIQNAVNAFDPASDELNLLHRRLAFPHCYADMGVAEIGYTPDSDADWKPNRIGLVSLLRMASGAGFHADFWGLYDLTEPNPTHEPALLYMAGSGGFKPLSDAEITGLTGFLTRGGTLLGEVCNGGQGFRSAFEELASKCSASLRPLAENHPLLSAHYRFPLVPFGASEQGALTLDDEAGVLLSTFDYGGAWQGKVSGDPTAARERTRQAQEWGINLLRWAGERKRRRELLRLA